MIVNVYVDGFNLYYGSLKGTPYRWLNIERLCQLHFPRDHINSIHYCTALVKARQSNVGQDVRQQLYIRALKTLPVVKIHYRFYLVKNARMPLASPVTGGPNTVEVVKSEEKGSDVNIATHLLLDAFSNAYEKAVVITNDGVPHEKRTRS